MIKFLLKRILVAATVFSILAFFIDGYNFFASLAVILGSVAAGYKLILWNRAFEALRVNSGKGGGKFTAMFVFVLVMTLVLMIVLAMVNVSLLLCFVAGYLTLPAIILINSLTEGLNITKNNWGENE